MKRWRDEIDYVGNDGLSSTTNLRFRKWKTLRLQGATDHSRKLPTELYRSIDIPSNNCGGLWLYTNSQFSTYLQQWSKMSIGIVLCWQFFHPHFSNSLEKAIALLIPNMTSDWDSFGCNRIQLDALYHLPLNSYMILHIRVNTMTTAASLLLIQQGTESIKSWVLK